MLDFAMLLLLRRVENKSRLSHLVMRMTNTSWFQLLKSVISLIKASKVLPITTANQDPVAYLTTASQAPIGALFHLTTANQAPVGHLTIANQAPIDALSHLTTANP